MLKISFEFEKNKKSIHNLKCEVLNKEQVNSNGKPIVEVGDNKLIISPEALSLLGAVPGDRISINYTQKSNEVTIPLIGKSEIFADREAGNKLTKSTPLLNNHFILSIVSSICLSKDIKGIPKRQLASTLKP